MPNPQLTESFSTLGMMNGFPFCLEKVDVSGYDYWTTVGGNKKGGSVTIAGQGLQQAANIFWNLWKLEFLSEYYDDPPSSEAVWVDGSNSNIAIDDEYHPKKRICADLDYATSYFRFKDELGFLVMYQEALTPYKMYNGATNDETNFVGYGLNNPEVAVADEDYGYFFDWASSGYVSLVLSSAWDTRSVTGFTVDEDYTDLNGYHFVCHVLHVNTGDGDTATGSASAANVSFYDGTEEEYHRVDLKDVSQFFNFHTYS